MEPIQDIAPPDQAPATAVLVDDEAESFEVAETTKASEAEKAREAAFAAEYTWERWNEDSQIWERYLLEPLSLDRWTWWHRMEHHNAPIPREVWDREKWSDEHVPTAWSLLYLCSHDSDHLLTLVPHPALYWFAVNAWAEIHCPGEKWQAALDLMRTMEVSTKLTLAVPRPTKGLRKRPGNAPRP